MLKNIGVLFAGLTLALYVPGDAAAQRLAGETLASDRPGIGNGAYVLASGEAQVELGVSLIDLDAEDQVQLPQALFRVGTGVVELRVLLNSLVIPTDGGSTGLQDAGVGAKVRLRETERSRVSAITTFTLPTGGGEFTSDQVGWDAGILYDLALSAALSVSLNGSYAIGLADGDDHWILTATPGLSFGSSGVGAFAGYAGFFGTGSDRHFAEGGITWLLGTETQLDVNAGVALEGDGHFVGIGVATRLSR